MKQQGIFRKSGVKTRIAKLRLFCEENPDGSDFCEYRENSPYDIADLGMVFETLIGKNITIFFKILTGDKNVRKSIYRCTKMLISPLT